MRAHVKRTVSRCFAALRQLHQIRRAVPTATFQMLVVALVATIRLDYGNAVLVAHPNLRGTPFAVGAERGGTIHLNLPSATARPHLWCVNDTALHWLRVPERVQYKIAVLTFTTARRDICGHLSPSLTGRASFAASKYQPPSHATHQTVYR